MAISDVSICNAALTKLGAARILTLADQTEPARVMSVLYEKTRDEEVQRMRWKFSLARASLSALVEAPAWGYAFQYLLPADFLALVQVGETYLPPLSKQVGAWSIEGGVLLTDLAAPLRMRYQRRVTDPALFPALFAETLACRLAMEACETLTQSDTKFQRVSRQYQQALYDAARVDAFETTPDQLPDGSWIYSREGNVGGAGEALGNTAYPAGFEVL
jgi:hypothetical protein